MYDVKFGIVNVFLLLVPVYGPTPTCDDNKFQSLLLLKEPTKIKSFGHFKLFAESPVIVNDVAANPLS